MYLDLNKTFYFPQGRRAAARRPATLELGCRAICMDRKSKMIMIIGSGTHQAFAYARLVVRTTKESRRPPPKETFEQARFARHVMYVVQVPNDMI